jgi:hypothetical protein
MFFQTDLLYSTYFTRDLTAAPPFIDGGVPQGMKRRDMSPHHSSTIYLRASALSPSGPGPLHVARQFSPADPYLPFLGRDSFFPFPCRLPSPPIYSLSPARSAPHRYIGTLHSV